jgi:ectoine hydroxylase-related dioxygenase (phytanoyl-CoA dioxygenase family)
MDDLAAELVSPTRVECLDAARAERLAQDGCLLLKGAVPADWLAPMRAAFDAGETDNWPAPRGAAWRHALVDLDPTTQAACRLPDLLACVSVLLGGRFFLGQIEGREPRQGGGHQGLHRDGVGHGPGEVVSALIYLDDYGPANGATRILPGGRGCSDGAEPPAVAQLDAAATVLEGQAGDILVFDSNVLHGATCNVSGARRRSLLVTWAIEAHYPAWRASEPMRAVRMDTSERFEA